MPSTLVRWLTPRRVALATFLVAISALTALGQTPPAPSPSPPAATATPDCFPASVVYVAFGAVATVITTLAGVITKLYVGGERRQKLHAIEIEKVRDKSRTECDAVRTHCHDELVLKDREIDKVRERYEAELHERRIESERLVREQKDILREVLTVTTTNATSLDGVKEAMKQLTAAIDRLGWDEQR